MSDRLKHDAGTFRPQTVEEIVGELPPEDGALIEALVALRRSPGGALRRRVQAITGAEGGGMTGRRIRPSRLHLMRQASIAIMMLLAVALLLIVAVPSVCAAFGRLMQQRFGLVLVEPVSEAAGPEVNAEALAEEEALPPISFEEAQAQVTFTIPLPAYLPEGFELWAAQVGTGPYTESVDEQGNRTGTEPPIQVILHFRPGDASAARYHPDATLSLDILDQTGLEGPHHPGRA